MERNLQKQDEYVVGRYYSHDLSLQSGVVVQCIEWRRLGVKYIRVPSKTRTMYLSAGNLSL